MLKANDQKVKYKTSLSLAIIFKLTIILTLHYYIIFSDKEGIIDVLFVFVQVHHHR